MNHNSQSSEKKDFYKRLLLVFATIIATIIIYQFLHSPQLRWAMMTPKERLADTTTQLIPQDLYQSAKSKAAQPTFESDYSAKRIYDEFTSNKVAFDIKNNDKNLDIFGTITRIKTDWGCAGIEIQAGNSAFDVISFSNCPEDVDKWKKEVAEVSVGSSVHIRGKYSAFSSSDFSMNLYGCHIIEP